MMPFDKSGPFIFGINWHGCNRLGPRRNRIDLLWFPGVYLKRIDSIVPKCG